MRALLAHLNESESLQEAHYLTGLQNRDGAHD